MTSSTTATVETLTAEVRVLMAGSRQVTMSVYNQLDEVPYDEIEPFGRVRPKDADENLVYAVGRDKESGALVRSRAWTWDMTRMPSVREIADAEIRPPFNVNNLDIAGLEALDSHCRSYQGSEFFRNLGEQCSRMICERETQDEWMLKHGQDWERLPLIVLAGLR